MRLLISASLLLELSMAILVRPLIGNGQESTPSSSPAIVAVTPKPNPSPAPSVDLVQQNNDALDRTHILVPPGSYSFWEFSGWFVICPACAQGGRRPTEAEAGVV